MKLISLRLVNFKGAKEFALETGGGNVNIFGDNGAGKSTIADAWSWLLFGKDSSNRADFEIKTLDASGRPLSGLDHEVTAVVQLQSGEQLELRRVYREQYTKRRGAAQAVFTGHTTDYYVNGVPKKAAEFNATINSIAQEGVFRLLSDPLYFNVHMNWQDRRQLLLEVCGDVTDADVIASDPALAELPAILGQRSLDDHRRVITAERRRINEELQRIPVRIDEATRAMPVVEGDRETLAARLEQLRTDRRQAEEELTRIRAGGQVAELQRRVAEIDGELLTVQNRVRAAANEATQELRQRANRLQTEVDVKRRDVQQLQREVDSTAAELERIEPRIEQLRAEWNAVNAEQLQYEQDATCPACGQALPEERLQAARERALAEFNRSKAERLQGITAEGKRLSDERDELREQNETAYKQAAIAEEILASMEQRLAETQAQLREAEQAVPAVADDPEHQRLEAERERIVAEIERLQASTREAISAVQNRAGDLDAAIDEVQRQLSRFDQRDRLQERIAELQAEERRLAAEFERLEHQLHLCETFIRAKVSLLEQRINSRFRMVRFRLFEEQINGGVTETCVATVNGVPFGSLNHGARINAGLDVIQTLSEYYQFAPPVFIDNAEAVTSLLPTRGQQIRLVVSAADKQLRVERDAPTTEEVA